MDYSKCTYKELNSILKRFERHCFKVDIPKCGYNYSQMSKEECSKIDKILYQEDYIDSDETREKYYILEKTILSNIQSLEGLKNYLTFAPVGIGLDGAKSNGIYRAREEKREELQNRKDEIKKIKNGNKRRFLLKGRV